MTFELCFLRVKTLLLFFNLSCLSSESNKSCAGLVEIRVGSCVGLDACVRVDQTQGSRVDLVERLPL